MDASSLSDLPAEAAIRAGCGARVFERGQDIAVGNQLDDVVRLGDELFASCEGSMGETYRLQIELEPGAVRASKCSCPFDGSGLCKHRVGLLLALREGTLAAENLPPLRALIGELSGEQQEVLLGNLLRRAPELLPLLLMARPVAAFPATQNGAPESESGSQTRFGGAALRAALRRALGGREASEGAVALELALGEAGALEAARDMAGAGAIYRLLLDELVRAAPRFEARQEILNQEGYGYEDEIDVGSGWAEQAFDGLERALQTENLAPELSAEWLGALWEGWKECQDLNYFQFPERARRLLSRRAPAEVWREIEAYLRAEIEKTRPVRVFSGINPGNGEQLRDFSGEHERETALQWLMEALQARGRGAECPDLLRQWGSRSEKFDLALREGDFERAETLARDGHSGSFALLKCAGALEAAGQPQRAANLGQIALDDEESQRKKWPLRGEVHAAHTVALEWMTGFWTRRANAAAAMKLGARLFALRPEAETLSLWRAAAGLQSSWEGSYGAREAELPDEKTRLQLAIKDGRAARALEIFDALPDKTRQPLTIGLALLCAAEFPVRALSLFQAAGEAFVASRSQYDARTVYREAAQMWRRARDLHVRLGTLAQWNEYLAAQRAQNTRLRALWDEVKKAGL